MRVLLPLLIALMLAASSTAWAAAGGVEVNYLDSEDRYSETAGVAACLRAIGIPARSGVPTKVTAGKSNLLIVGSFVSGLKGKKPRSLLSGQAAAIRRFVAAGGTVLVLGQSAADDGDLAWLPEPLKAKRSSRDALAARIVHADHPLLSGVNQLTAEELMPGHVLRKRGWTASSLVGATDLFMEAHGFEVLATDATPDSYPLLMVGESGPGTVILTSMHPDKACAYPLYPEEREKARKFFENAVAFAANKSQRPTRPADFVGQPASRTVLVYEDLNGNRVQDPGEPGMAGVEVLYGLDSYPTSSDGTASVPVSPADLSALSVAIPDGCRATSDVFLQAGGSLSFEVGVQREGNRSGEAVIYQLSDVHIGDEAADSDSRYLLQFLTQLEHLAGSDGLVAITGDVTQRGYQDEYNGFVKAIQAITNPHIVTMGNHDEGDGPEAGRLFEEYVGPVYYSMDWRGIRIISLPVLETSGAVGEWLRRRIESTSLPVWILTHKYPSRKAFDALDRTRVVAVLSGHWHGDMVSTRSGVLNINLGTSVFGAWDFTPASARRIAIHNSKGQAVVETQLLPYVRYAVAGAQQTSDGTWHIGATLPVDSAPLTCTSGGAPLTLERAGPFSWRAQGVGSADIACRAGGAPIPMKCSGTAADVGAAECPRPTTNGLRLLWATQLPGRVLLGSPITYGSHLIVPLRGSDRSDSQGGVCSVAISSGALEWCHHTSSAVATTPVVADGVLLVNEVTGNRWGLDPNSGRVYWNRSLDEAITPRYLHHYLYAPGVESAGRVYYCYQSAPFGVKPSTGEVTWTGGGGFAGPDHFGLSAGYIDGDYLYCTAYLGGLYRYNINVKNAKREELNPNLVTCSNLTLANGLLWVLTRDDLQGLGRSGWAPQKRFSLSSFILPVDPQFTEGGVVVPYGSNSIAMLNTETGKKKWSFGVASGPMSFETNKHESAGIVGNPVVSGKRVYVPGTDGTLSVLEGGKLVASSYLGVPIASTPVVRSGVVLVADYGGRVYAFAGNAASARP